MVEIRSGDQVQLFSGGPVMSVNRVTLKDGEPEVECVWFGPGRTFNRQRLSVFTLLKLADSNHQHGDTQGTTMLKPDESGSNSTDIYPFLEE